MPKNILVLRWYGLALLIVVADLASKGWISAHFHYAESMPVTGFLNIVLVHNTGAAFSFLSDAGGWQRWLFSLFAFGISIWISLWIYKAPAKQWALCGGLALVLGGALGNLWERLTQGYVVDFIDFYYQSYHWPAFNVADSAICIGAALLLIDSLFLNKDSANE